MRLHNRPRTLSSFVLALACLLAASAVVRATYEDKQLSVYAPQGTYSVRVIDDENRESADLMAVLAPISKVVLRIDGNTARFPGGIAEAHFNHGENSAQVGQKRVRFPGKISIVEGRVFVPVVALPALLQEMVGMRGELHEAGRRLFVENTFSHFTVELKKGESPEMLLSFPQRVNPNITQEGNKLRLVFRQEPVTMTGSGITFDDPRLTGLHFEEKNGTAEITISGAAPLMVTFLEQGKVLSIKLAPSAAAAAVPAGTPPVAPSATPPLPVNPAATLAPPSAPIDTLRYFVMIDAGHGGSDPGVRFSEKIIEKDITLALAKRLRIELQNRGVPAVLVRDSDTTLSNDQRAVAANGQRAAIFISLHAGTLGTGVRVYAPVMPRSEALDGPFIPWQRAQESYRQRSTLLARAVANEVNGKKVPARMLSVAIPPLHAIGAPAIAVEVAPPTLGAAVEEFDKAAYQQAIVIGIANAIVNTRNKLEEMR